MLSGRTLLEKEEEGGGCRKSSRATTGDFYMLRRRERRPHSTYPVSFLVQAGSAGWLDEKDRTWRDLGVFWKEETISIEHSLQYFRNKRKTQCVEGSVPQLRAEGFIVEPRVVRAHFCGVPSFCALMVLLNERGWSSQGSVSFLKSTEELMNASGCGYEKRKRSLHSTSMYKFWKKRRSPALIAGQGAGFGRRGTNTMMRYSACLWITTIEVWM